jgi:hypothetical protein
MTNNYSNLTLVLSNEFDAYLIPEDEPEHQEYISRCEKEIDFQYPNIKIDYRSADTFDVDGLDDPDKIEDILLNISNIFFDVYNEMAKESETN